MVPTGSVTTTTKEIAARVVKQAKAERIPMYEALKRYRDALARDLSAAEETAFAQLWSGSVKGSGVTSVLGAAVLGAALGRWASR